MYYLLLPILQGILGRMAGTGFGQKWGLSFLPELLHSIPYGVALGWALSLAGVPFVWALAATALGAGVSYAGMQSATWYFLRWESHDDPNTDRDGTLKKFIDWLASRWGYVLGDEGYAWVAASVKGFIITLPVGGFLGAVLFPLGHEIGTHAEGRLPGDPQMYREFLSSALASLSIIIFVLIVEVAYA